MYQLIIYYRGPEEYTVGLIFRKIKHRWYYNPQLYDDRSSSPIWNGGVSVVSFNANEDYRATLETVIRTKVDKLIEGGIQVDRHGQFVVDPKSIKISLEKED